MSSKYAASSHIAGSGGTPADGSITTAKLADGAVTAVKVGTGTIKRRAILMGVGGTFSATMSDTADFPVIVPFDCTVVGIKAYRKVASADATVVTIRKSADAATPTFADLDATTNLTFSISANRKSVTGLSVNLTEGDILNFSIGTGGTTGANMIVEVIIEPR